MSTDKARSGLVSVTPIGKDMQRRWSELMSGTIFKERRAMQASVIGLATAGLLTMTMCAFDGRPVSVNEGAAEQGGEAAAETMAWTLARDSQIRLAGSATIGSWDCAGQRAEAELVPGAPLAALLALVERVEQDGSLTAERLELELERSPAASLAVRIAALNCGNAKMERDMHEALKAEAHPQILYALNKVRQVRIERQGGDVGEDEQEVVFVIDTVGELSLAGVSQEVEMAVRVRRVGEHRFAVLGSKALSMHDFDIEPPTALLGLIRAHPQVEVVFDLVVEPAVAGEPAE